MDLKLEGVNVVCSWIDNVGVCIVMLNSFGFGGINVMLVF